MILCFVWKNLSPDLNPSNNLWDEMDHRLRARPYRPTTVTDLTIPCSQVPQNLEWRQLKQHINAHVLDWGVQQSHMGLMFGFPHTFGQFGMNENWDLSCFVSDRRQLICTVMTTLPDNGVICVWKSLGDCQIIILLNEFSSSTLSTIDLWLWTVDYRCVHEWEMRMEEGVCWGLFLIRCLTFIRWLVGCISCSMQPTVGRRDWNVAVLCLWRNLLQLLNTSWNFTLMGISLNHPLAILPVWPLSLKWHKCEINVSPELKGQK